MPNVYTCAAASPFHFTSHVMNFTRLLHFSACIVEELGGASLAYPPTSGSWQFAYKMLVARQQLTKNRVIMQLHRVLYLLQSHYHLCPYVLDAKAFGLPAFTQFCLSVPVDTLSVCMSRVELAQ